MRIYETISGRHFSLDRLDDDERRVFDRLYRYARGNPDWNRFANRWWPAVRDLYATRGLPIRRITRKPLYSIAQDIEGRLGIRQGRVAVPDYRDDLAALIETTRANHDRSSRRRGLPQGLLSRVTRRGRSLSLTSLNKLVDALGYRITFARNLGSSAIEDAIVVYDGG